jgi:hypothetical protein
VRRLAVIAAALAVAGCGTGAGDAPDEVALTVTDGFGARSVLDKPAPEVSGEETVMRLLQRNAKVRTRYGGGFVQSIGSLSGGRERGRPVDWFYYVNGVLAEKGANATEVRAGDRVWWDRRDWSVTNTVPAVVGSFPEPFLHGIEGERPPTRIECDDAVSEACDLVQKQFTDRGLVVGQSGLDTDAAESLRVVVGRWPEIRRDRALSQIARGPKVSGVYARVEDDGRFIQVLDAGGRTKRRLGPNTGLIAATRWREEPPTWVVTGTDAAGIAAAARAFTERTLRNRFAVVVDEGEPTPVPVVVP